MSSSLIGCPIYSALCRIEAKSFVNYILLFQSVSYTFKRNKELILFLRREIVKKICTALKQLTDFAYFVWKKNWPLQLILMNCQISDWMCWMDVGIKINGCSEIDCQFCNILSWVIWICFMIGCINSWVPPSKNVFLTIFSVKPISQTCHFIQFYKSALCKYWELFKYVSVSVFFFFSPNKQLLFYEISINKNGGSKSSKLYPERKTIAEHFCCGNANITIWKVRLIQPTPDQNFWKDTPGRPIENIVLVIGWLILEALYHQWC